MFKSKFVIGTLSNGDVGMLLNMAKYGGLQWDCVLDGELAGSYKPDPKIYLMVGELLGIEPQEVMMTAAHNHDLIAAKQTGLSTAFVSRPDEYGVSARKPDLVAAAEADVSATDFVDLAIQLVV